MNYILKKINELYELIIIELFINISIDYNINYYKLLKYKL